MRDSVIIDPMCARRVIPLACAALLLASCASPERTGTAFCRQVARELPAIGQPPMTPADVSAMVGRYERLLARAPLGIEADLAILTDLLKMAASVNPKDEAEVQRLADAAYAANQSAKDVRAWVKDTCAVDIATGVNVTPPRTAPDTTTTVAPTSTVAG